MMSQQLRSKGCSNEVPANAEHFLALKFLMFVEVGSNNGGWWNGTNFHVQGKDIANCFKVLYPGKVPVMFTDWSQGHTGKWPDGLDPTRMNKGFRESK
jgi:hypothetical protein